MESFSEGTVPRGYLSSLWSVQEGVATGAYNENAAHYLDDGEDNGNNYQNCDYWTEEQIESKQSSSSRASTASPGSGLTRKEQEAATICACFLKDYEGGQPPTLSSNFSGISRRQLLLYRVKHSFNWNFLGLTLATILLFIPSFQSWLLTLLLHAYSIVVFATDLYMKEQFLDDHQKYNSISGDAKGPFLFETMKGFLFLMSIQSIACFFLPNNSFVHTFTLAVSVFKPIVFFYQSRRARDALEALIRISKKLLRVILIELFLILTFAAVACRLYNDHESFQSLPQAWLSLFARELLAKHWSSILSC